MRTIGVVTVGRSDYGIYLPLLRKIREDADLRLHLVVSGMHLSPQYGLTLKQIEADGFGIGDRVDMLLSSDTPEAVSKSLGLGVIGFAQSFARLRPDILVVLGDRFEMFAAALSALPFKIPLAHIHGGELTEGAMDDALRHAITKLSHIHFVSTEEYGKRVVQMGEEPWRVSVTGAPSLDNLNSLRLMEPAELESRYGACMGRAPLLVTYHPVTLEYEETEWQTGELLAALDLCGAPVVFTLPNADTSNFVISRMIRAFVESHSSAKLVDSFGMEGYFSMMARAAAMVGNSSSGIVEAPSMKLPVVNVGNRQKGRVRARNVIDVECARSEILEGIKKALNPAFREKLKDLVNPYGTGKAAEKIVEVLKEMDLGQKTLVKRFYDVSPSVSALGWTE